jgi:Uma2 family endonuclease
MPVLSTPPGVSAFTPPMPAPTASPYPRLVRWTVAEFHKARSTGVWDGRRTYLVRGVIWEQGPMNPPHATLVMIAQKAIDRVLPAGMCLRARVPLVLGQDTDPFPDLAVVPGDLTDYLTAHPTSAHLVVEVADTTVFEDTTTKAELYAAGGVADYWVVDVNARLLRVFRDPQPVAGTYSYRTSFSLDTTQTVSLLAVPTASIRVSDLIP